MEIPSAQQRQKYIDSMKALEAEIKHATTGDEVSDVALQLAQEQLDKLAEKYQNDERIGSARYKLYELQAFIHYFENKNDSALAFINQAMDTKGGTYPKAEKLIASLSTTAHTKPAKTQDEAKMSKTDKREKLIGLEGWLALFIVGQIIALILTVIRFFSDGFLSSSDIEAINQQQYGLGDSIWALSTFENLAILVYVALMVTTLVLLFKKRKLAKNFAIATLVFSAVYGTIDYAISSSLFNSSDIFQTSYVQAIMSEYAGDVGRSIVGAFIWVPYFLVSKRVKATLTK